MKIQTLTQDLAKALATAIRFTGGKVQLPILANVLLKSEKNKLLICATNLENSILVKIGAKVEKEGQITVPGKLFYDLISNLPSGSLMLEEEGEKLNISAESFESVILGMNASDFPSIPQSGTKSKIKISSKDISDVLRKTLFSISLDETRPVLTGMLVWVRNKKIEFVATDGFRLSCKLINLGNITLDSELKVIIPKNTLSEVLRLSSGVESVELSYDKENNQVVFTAGESVLSSRVIQGDFPDFEKIIPKKISLVLEIDREDFLRAVKLASVFAREESLALKIKIKGKNMEVSAESARSGKQKTTIDIKSTSEDELFVAFNYRFLEEFLNCVEGDSIKGEIVDAVTPVVFRDLSDENFFHIIMPIRLNV